jgi:prepilin-type N-terminal cleavage/methylation domain-containing protein
MNKKGFTLTEIIGAVIILGILVIIAVITFTGNMKGFREDYYRKTIQMLKESGKEFFNDNRKYRPSDMLQAQIVPLSTLTTQNYIDEIKDYKGNQCSNTSYAIIIKVGKDDYDYHACITCPEDEYNNMNDKYCNPVWKDPTTITYDIDGVSPNIYIRKPQDQN